MDDFERSDGHKFIKLLEEYARFLIGKKFKLNNVKLITAPESNKIGWKTNINS